MHSRFFIVFLLMAGLARADELTLKNGDKLTGKVVGLKGGKLQFETGHSGIVTVDWTQVATLKTDGSVAVKLADGRILNGKVVLGADGKFQVDADAVDPASLKSFNEPPVEWHGFVDFSARSTDGNTHTTGAVLNAEAVRATDFNKITAKLTSRYSETVGIITERSTYGMGKYEHTLSGDLYGYGSAEFFSDTFKDLTLRSVLSAGAGYNFYKTDAMEFSAEAGLMYVDTNFRNAKDESHVGARIAGRARVALPLGFEFTDVATFYLNAEDNTDWQAHNEAAVGRTLGGGWAFRAGMITDWDDFVPAGVRKYDNVYYVGLGFKF